METFNIALDMKVITEHCRARGVDNVSRDELETVIRAVLTQYIKDGWASEVLYAEVRQLREDPANYNKEADVG